MFRKIFLLGILALSASCASQERSKPEPVTTPPVTTSDPWEIKRLPLNEATIYLARSIIEGMSARGIEGVAVVDIRDLENNSTILGRQLAEDLATVLIRSDKFGKVIERRLMETIIEEQKFQLSDLIDIKTAMRLGRLCGVDGIVSGTVNEGPVFVRVNIRLIATETGENFSSAQVEIIKDQQVTDWLRRVIREGAASDNVDAAEDAPLPTEAVTPGEVVKSPAVIPTPAMSEDGTKYFGYFTVPSDWQGSARLVRVVNDSRFYLKLKIEHKPVVLSKRGVELEFMPNEENAKTTTLFLPSHQEVWCLMEGLGIFKARAEVYDNLPPYPRLEEWEIPFRVYPNGGYVRFGS